MNEPPVLSQLAVLLVRPGVVVALAPTFGGLYATARTKVGLTVMLAIGLLPSVVVPPAIDAAALGGFIAREVVIGLALALAVRALVGGVEFAGHLSGQQMGLTYAGTIDPSSGAKNTVVTALFNMVAVLTLFAMDGHHTILRALAASYTGLPVGDGGVNASLVTSVRETLALVFVTAVRLSAPMVVVLLIAEIVIGFISRVTPALSFMVIGFPIRMLLGLFVLGLVVTTLPGIVHSLHDRAIRLGLDTAGAFR
jgi:flagellar biosynthetic protein FliR